MRYFLIFFCIIGGLSAETGNHRIYSFSKAKKILYSEVFNSPDLKKTIYCNCSYKDLHHVDLKSCGYVPRKNKKRAARIEAEHVVPAHAFGQSFPEWRKGSPKCVNGKGKSFKGRRCARKVNRDFRRMEADLYNLFPAVGEVNGDRSNYSMAVIAGEARAYGKCDVEIENRKIEPRPEIRGDIARVYMYMEKNYPGHGIISKKNRNLFDVWDKKDPVDRAECERVGRIERIQGNRNSVVLERCEKLNLK